MGCMTEEEQACVKFLREECCYPHVVLTGDGRYAAIYPLMFTHAIIVGKVGDRTGYDDRWCYEQDGSALAALVRWHLDRFEGEPDGWHRNPKTGRRRPDGDQSQEHVDF